jgi:hypothetical protein
MGRPGKVRVIGLVTLEWCHLLQAHRLSEAKSRGDGVVQLQIVSKYNVNIQRHGETSITCFC